MITQEFSNSKNITEDRLAAVAAAVALRKQRQQDYRDGRRKYWRGLPPCYCANADETAGWDAAADEDAAMYAERQAERDEYAANRMSLYSA